MGSDVRVVSITENELPQPSELSSYTPATAILDRGSKPYLYLWVVYVGANTTPAGYIALRQELIKGARYNLMEYCFTEQCWECGAASIALKQTFAIAKEKLGLFAFSFFIDKRDERSIALTVELDMCFYGNITFNEKSYQLYQIILELPLSEYNELGPCVYDFLNPIAGPIEVAFYGIRLQSFPGPVLELMSGSGRLLAPLLKNGFNIEGVDNSPEMIRRCRARCAKLGKEPVLYQQDVFSLSLPKQYAAALIPMNSIMHFSGSDQIIQLLQGLHHYVATGGLLLLDVFIQKEMLSLKGQMRHQGKYETPDGTIINDVQIFTNPAKQFYSLRRVCTLQVSGKLDRQEITESTVRWFYRFEIDEILSKSGFKLLKIYENPYQSFAGGITYEAIAI